MIHNLIRHETVIGCMFQNLLTDSKSGEVHSNMVSFAECGTSSQSFSDCSHDGIELAFGKASKDRTREVRHVGYVIEIQTRALCQAVDRLIYSAEQLTK